MIVTILLRIGALFLISVLIVFIIRVFRDQGFVIETFSVPVTFELGWLRLGQSLELFDRREEGIAAVRRALVINPDEPYRWINLAWMLHREGKYPAADSAFKQATRRVTTEGGVWLAWADSKVSRGDLDGADSILTLAQPLLSPGSSTVVTTTSNKPFS